MLKQSRSLRSSPTRFSSVSPCRVFSVVSVASSKVTTSRAAAAAETQPVTQRNAVSPLARNGMMLVPSLTHVVSTGQPLYFYEEVYEPALLQSDSPRLLTSIAFFRGKVKTYETPLVEVTKLDAPDRKAAVFQYSVPASALKPGYVVRGLSHPCCQWFWFE